MTFLGALNFLVLQWFGVRLARVEFAVEGVITQSSNPANIGRRSVLVAWKAHNGRAYADSRMLALGEVPSLASYKLLRWVWPLTGWWSDYRWIARRK